MNNKISVCVIAKNEEQNIEKCLISVKDIANEIIVLDTGSTDNTAKLASKYATVYPYVWQNDFSKARNACISYTKSDWIMFIDADEVLSEETSNTIDKFLDSYSTDKPWVFNFRIINHIKEKVLPEVYRSTLFKNGFGINFTKQVGEYLNVENETLNIEKCPQFIITHNKMGKNEINQKALNYIDFIKNIINTNISIAEKCSYYVELGDYYSIMDNNLESYDYYLNAYNLSESIKNQVSNSFFENVLTRIINNLLLRNEFKDSLVYIGKIRNKNNIFYKIPEFINKSNQDIINYFCLGAYAHQMFQNKQYKNAIPLYEYIIEFFNTNIESMELKIYYYNMLTDLARLYLLEKQNEKAINTLIYLFTLKNNSREILIQIVKYYFEHNNINKIIYFLTNSTNNSPDIIEISKNLNKNMDITVLKDKISILLKTSTWLEV